VKGARRILDELRRARVLLILPQDEENMLLRDHLRRLGCEVRVTWPPPQALPEDIDTVFVSVDDSTPDRFAKMLEGVNATVIAIVTYESPTSLQALYDLNAHGCMSRPLRPLGILTQFTIARFRQRSEARQAAKIRKLEETLKGRRLVDRAVNLLVDAQGLSEDDAYKLLRDQATSERVALSAIAEEIVTAHETMTRFGLGRTGAPAPGGGDKSRR